MPSSTPFILVTGLSEPVNETLTGCQEEQIDINTASREELDRIIHIGPQRAGQILRLRPFSSVDDMIRIKGIGPARLGDIKAQGLACVASPVFTLEPTVNTTSDGCREGQININTASAEELDRLVNIGPVRAGYIIRERPFASLDDLLRVYDIGPQRLADIKAQGLACVE